MEIQGETVMSHSVEQRTEFDADSKKRDLIEEEPLSIRIQGKPYSVVMRTPGDELAHVAGFCLGEGLHTNQTFRL